jgi:hypothetical protein
VGHHAQNISGSPVVADVAGLGYDISGARDIFDNTVALVVSDTESVKRVPAPIFQTIAEMLR